MTKIFCDGSTTNICFIIGNQKPVVKPAIDEATKVTVNEGEWYALIHALQEAQKQGINDVEIKTDSENVVRWLTGVYRTKDQRMANFKVLVWSMLQWFDSATVTHVKREDNLAGKILEKGEGK